MHRNDRDRGGGEAFSYGIDPVASPDLMTTVEALNHASVDLDLEGKAGKAPTRARQGLQSDPCLGARGGR
ncbi:hypothetical protein Ahu01nite_098250 [Winogradskya humida]|uniref:Uncharacterized protein n=1 Tax=Winogradskya humida TaxID=113566 RepID=A0ABQ4A7V9_9ACTN|nr:hypothetical protein Ahu01nite_098250 [Actinoplanes humidus]